jgi:iron(III) transport system substrate-binding protein
MVRWSKALLVAALLAFAAGCGGGDEDTETRQATPQAPGGTQVAQASQAPAVRGTLTVYNALDQKTVDAMVAAFKKKYPDVNVNVLGVAAAGEVATRIRAEKDSPKADVFIGGDRAFHEGLAKDGLTLAYKSPVAGQIDSQYYDPEGKWYGWYIGVLGIVINTDRFKDARVAEPKTWDDLLDPAWKGKLAFPNPTTTGGGYIFLADQVFRFNKDEAKALDYMKKLDGNVAQYTQRSPDAINVVAQGEFVAAMNWAHDILVKKNQGFPLKLIIPPDTAYEVGGASVIKGGPNSEAGKAFLDWVLGPEAGKINSENSYRLSVRNDVPAPEGAIKLSEVKLVTYDANFAASEKDRLLKAWQSATGK